MFFKIKKEKRKEKKRNLKKKTKKRDLCEKEYFF